MPDALRIINRIHPGRSMVPAFWPGGKGVAVALTFDLDAELVWMRSPEKTPPSNLSQGQFGPRAGVERILRVLDARKIPATFFLPALTLELHPDTVAAIRQSGLHEIGYHGYAHEDVRTLSAGDERGAMERGLAIFAKVGLRPRVHRSAAWNFSENTLGLLRESGFLFDSSLMADDRPYEIMSGASPAGIVELPVDWSLDDWPYFQADGAGASMGPRNPDDVLAIWRGEFDGARAGGGLFVLTMHPQVIGRWGRIRMLERLLDHIDQSGGAWYGSLSRIGEHVKTAQ